MDNVFDMLYERIVTEVDSLGMQNKLFDELDYAANIYNEDKEQAMFYINRVVNTLDTL